MTAAPVRLRGHHLLCILTYVGKGYSPAFVDAMDDVVARISAGSTILLVNGPDDICAAHVAGCASPHCHDAGPAERDAAALRDVGHATGRGLAPGSTIAFDAETLARHRAAFAAGTTRAACAGCDWSELCTSLAAGGFAGMRLGG